jgi:hypothetical protein
MWHCPCVKKNFETVYWLMLGTLLSVKWLFKIIENGFSPPPPSPNQGGFIQEENGLYVLYLPVQVWEYSELSGYPTVL